MKVAQSNEKHLCIDKAVSSGLRFLLEESIILKFIGEVYLSDKFEQSKQCWRSFCRPIGCGRVKSQEASGFPSQFGDPSHRDRNIEGSSYWLLTPSTTLIYCIDERLSQMGRQLSQKQALTIDWKLMERLSEPYILNCFYENQSVLKF